MIESFTISRLIRLIYRIEQSRISKKIKLGEVFDGLSVLGSRIGSPSRDLSFVMVYSKIVDFMFQEFNRSYSQFFRMKQKNGTQ